MTPQLLLVCCAVSTNLQLSVFSVVATNDDDTGTPFCPFEENRLLATVALPVLDCSTLVAGSMVAVTGLGLIGVKGWLKFCEFVTD